MTDEIVHSATYPWFILPSEKQLERAAKMYSQFVIASQKQAAKNGDFLAQLLSVEGKEDDWKLYLKDVFLPLFIAMNKDHILNGDTEDTTPSEFYGHTHGGYNIPKFSKQPSD